MFTGLASASGSGASDDGVALATGRPTETESAVTLGELAGAEISGVGAMQAGECGREADPQLGKTIIEDEAAGVARKEVPELVAPAPRTE